MSKPTTDEARVPRNYASRAARLMAEARWKGTTPEERTAIMTAAGNQGGRPRSRKRCFCGRATMWTACNRNFDCCRKAGKITLKLKKGQTANYDQRN
jgi:hypothetical protein